MKIGLHGLGSSNGASWLRSLREVRLGASKWRAPVERTSCCSAAKRSVGSRHDVSMQAKWLIQ
jgi:hypothetical protein